MSEWSNVPVLKTGEGNTSGGSNPPLPAIQTTTSQTPLSASFQKIQTHYQVHYYDTMAKKYDTPLRLYKVGYIFYYRRRYKKKLYRISLKTKYLKVALHRKKLLDFISGDEMFKMKSGDYELIF